LRQVCGALLKPGSSDFLAVRGIRYHVRTWGDSAAPKLFLLHGWMDVSASFQFLVDEFARDWRIIAPDWRGFGLSDWASADCYWFPDYIADLEAVLRHYQPDQPVDVLGHSLGGNVASLYAGIRSGRVGRLINVEGFGLPRMRHDDAPARYAKWLDQIADPPRLRPYATHAELAARLMTQNPRLTQDKADFLAQHWGKRQGDSIILAGDPGHKLVNPTLYRIEEAMACWRRVTAPVLWVGAEDSSVMKRYAEHPDEYAARKACFAELTEHIIPDAGHMVHHDQPAVLAGLVEDFLAQA
jgi:pimeloyl-ACP methyl ester carboxylesterase